MRRIWPAWQRERIFALFANWVILKNELFTRRLIYTRFDWFSILFTYNSTLVFRNFGIFWCPNARLAVLRSKRLCNTSIMSARWTIFVVCMTQRSVRRDLQGFWIISWFLILLAAEVEMVGVFAFVPFPGISNLHHVEKFSMISWNFSTFYFISFNHKIIVVQNWRTKLTMSRSRIRTKICFLVWNLFGTWLENTAKYVVLSWLAQRTTSAYCNAIVVLRSISAVICIMGTRHCLKKWMLLKMAKWRR